MLYCLGVNQGSRVNVFSPTDQTLKPRKLEQYLQVGERNETDEHLLVMLMQFSYVCYTCLQELPLPPPLNYPRR